MIFYLIAGALTALVLAVLLHPLLRRRKETAAGGGEELEVYKAQLADIERDLAAGTLPAEEAEAARREVERRILAADDARRRAAASGRPTRGLAVALLAIVLLAGPGLYLLLGSPDTPAQPHAEREDVEMQRQLQQRAAAIRTRLAQNPGDVEGWQELAFLRTMLGEVGAAVEAYRQAIAHGADKPEVYASLAEALIVQAEGEVTKEARQALAKALALNPQEPLALYYIGHALEQDGEYKLALKLWRDMAAVVPAGSRWHLRLLSDIARVEAEAGKAQ